MPNLAPIFETIGKVRLRVRIQNGLEWVATGAVVGLLLSLAFLALGRFGLLSEGASSVGVIAGFLLAPLGLIAGLLQPVSPLAAAKRIDLSHDLKDRFSSAVDFSSKKHDPANEEERFQAQMEELSMREALTFAGEVKASKAAPLSTPKDLVGALAMALALVFASMIKLPPEQPAAAPKPLQTLTPVLVDSFDLEQQKEKAKQLLLEAQQDGDKKTAELAEKLLNLWAAVEKGELTQEAALRQLAALEKEFGDAAKQKEALEKTAAELAKAFEKNADTKDLAEALKNQDFDKAAQELEKLAEKLDKMSPKDREKLQEALERAAKAAEEMAKEDKRELDQEDPDEENKDPKSQEEKDKEEEAKRELDNCASLDVSTATSAELEECDKKFDEKELEERRRELEKDERQLEKLRRENKEKKEQEEQKRQLEKLSRDMKKAAEELAKKLTPEQKEALKQASEQMKKMGEKQRYANRQQKAAGKIGDAKNVIIRGGKGKSGQAQNFRDRASGKGQKGQNGEGNQPGEGQQPGQGKGNQPGEGQGEGQNGKGQNPGKGQGKGDTYVIDLDNPGQGDTSIELPGFGDGEQAGKSGDQPGDQPGGGEGDEPGDQYGKGSKDPLGKATGLDVNFTNEKLTGRKGAGPSNVEVIERVAQEGLVGSQYKKVYKEASREAEDSLEREKVPVGYKRFTKRYFDLIQPQ